MHISSEECKDGIEFQFLLDNPSIYYDLEELILIIKAFSSVFADKISKLENPADFEKNLKPNDVLSVIAFRLMEESFPKGSMEALMGILDEFSKKHDFSNLSNVTQ